jgi:drug/metabolite transporter (DMT)-like permease
MAQRCPPWLDRFAIQIAQSRLSPKRTARSFDRRRRYLAGHRKRKWRVDRTGVVSRHAPDTENRQGAIDTSITNEPSTCHLNSQYGRSQGAHDEIQFTVPSRELLSTTLRSARRSSPDLLLLLLLSALWGMSYSFIRVAVATIPPLTLIAARTLIAGALLAAWMVARKISLPRDPVLWRRFLVQAVLNSVVPFTLIAWAEQTVEAGLATILNSTSPVMTFLATWLITRHEHVSARKLFGVIAGLAGICMIVGTSVLGGLGEQVVQQLAIVAATVCYAGAAIYSRSFHALPPVVPAVGSLVAGAGLLIPGSLVVEHPWTLHPSISSLVALLALSVFSTAAAFVIYFRLIQTLGSVATTSQAYLRVPIGVALSVIFLGESLAPAAWIGMLCVVAGVAAMTLPRRAAETN